MPIQHLPYWLDRIPRSRRPSHPRLRGAVQADIVIIGGGLTGSACAYTFAAAGLRVVLLEADRLGHGAASRGSGLVREDFEASFERSVAAHGLAASRTMWQAQRRAGLDFAAVLRRLGIRCDLAPAALLDVAPPDPEAARRLKRELAARRQAGLPHAGVSPRAAAALVSLETGGAIRTRGASLDPYRACLGLAAAAAARGAVIHEQSAVLRVRTTKTGVDVRTASGSVTARAVIVATPAPMADLRALRRHLEPRLSYTVVTAPMPGAMRRAVGARAADVRHGVEPPHLLRWLPGDRILFQGAPQGMLPARSREKALVQRTGQLMYELSLLYPDISGLPAASSWDTEQYETADHLPFAGLHRNFPRHLFAMGGSLHGPAFSWLAARMLLRIFEGRAEKGDDLFGFVRVL